MSREILVWEYLSGGGLANDLLSASLLCEGVAMLRAIAYDFAQAGFKVTIPLDDRLISLKEWLPPSRILSIKKKDDLREILKQEATRTRSFFIIAPEFDCILFSFTHMLEDVAQNWGCCSEFIKIFENKWETGQFWKAQGISTPRTWELSPPTTEVELLKILKECNNKIIIKPAFGAGAENIFACSSENIQNPHYLSSLMQKIDKGGYLAQEFIAGIACSANFMVVSNEIKLLCVNDQIIQLETKPAGQSRYIGGVSPAQSLLKYLTPHSIQAAFQPLIESFPSPERGFFGVDFICDPRGALHFIEVNSRLTTSYIALTRIMPQNPISLMLDGKTPLLEDTLHRFNEILYYRKLTLFEGLLYTSQKAGMIQKLKEPTLPQVYFACPPLQDSYGNAACFISITGATCKSITQHFSAAKQFLSRNLD